MIAELTSALQSQDCIASLRSYHLHPTTYCPELYHLPRFFIMYLAQCFGFTKAQYVYKCKWFVGKIFNVMNFVTIECEASCYDRLYRLQSVRICWPNDFSTHSYHLFITMKLTSSCINGNMI